MIIRGEIQLNDPVQTLLPEGAKLPEQDAQQITLIDLATHRSGLPRISLNLKDYDPTNPYVDYTAERLYEFLSTYELPRAIGEQFEYSNIGMGLLGHALAQRAKTSYRDLVIERILVPLGMKDTRIALSPSMQTRLAQGHNGKAQPTPNWDFPMLAGAGALRSTASDMLHFLKANLDGKILAAALSQVRIEKSTAGTDMAIGLGWLINKKYEDKPILWHDGGTGGSCFFMGLDMESRRGVVVLTNGQCGVNDIGFHLLDIRYMLSQPEPLRFRTEIHVDPQLLSRVTHVVFLVLVFESWIKTC
jgi:D-alanyl-D-alanine-carboxypeptidase/D-alanyl-D-alanine-endopeptidase